MLPKNNFDTQWQKGTKFSHKIHKIAIIMRHFTCAPWRTDVGLHSHTLYKAVELNLYELTVKINLRHCLRIIQLYVQL